MHNNHPTLPSASTTMYSISSLGDSDLMNNDETLDFFVSWKQAKSIFLSLINAFTILLFLALPNPLTFYDKYFINTHCIALETSNYYQINFV